MLEQSQILWQNIGSNQGSCELPPCLAGLGKSTSPSSNQYMAYVCCWEAGPEAPTEVRCFLILFLLRTVGLRSQAGKQWEVAESLLLGKLYLSH